MTSFPERSTKKSKFNSSMHCIGAVLILIKNPKMRVQGEPPS